MPLELPYWCDEIRPYQVQALQDILSVYESGSTVAVLDAPTGSGKTLIGELVRQSLGVRTLYLCTSISLQEQFIKDFPHAALVKGRSNYPTADSPTRYPELSAADCTKERSYVPTCPQCDPDTAEAFEMHCRWCHPITDCPYECAKATAIRSDLVCTNTAYFLHEANYVGALPLARQLIIVDEADLLEDNLLSFVEVSITQRKAKELGISTPTRKTVESAWVEWADETYEHLKKVKANGKYRGTSISAIRQRQSLELLLSNVSRLTDDNTGLANGGWVYTGYDQGTITFRPISVEQYANRLLWDHSPKWLLMSATTISFPVLMSSLGL
jgi:Rad3-related DNA helicase